ncbi:hypothetical protein ACEXOX_00910 [Streptomyces sp. Ac-502]
MVLGGGLTGMLAAAVLAEHAEVQIVEHDLLPVAPAPRKGLTQAQHAHLLWSGGARTIESLLPGITQQWLATGARRIPLPTGLVSLTAAGWLRRWPEMQHLIACSRDLLDWGVRQQVLAHPRIRVLSGTRGGQPTREASAFLPFARNVRHPIVANLIADVEPLTDVRLSRSTVNRRRRFDLLRNWPRGFAVLGDAVATYNPLYGQGMSVAAQEAAALRDALNQYGLGAPTLARRLQRTVGRLTQAPWAMATGQDIRYPGAIGPRPPQPPGCCAATPTAY